MAALNIDAAAAVGSTLPDALRDPGNEDAGWRAGTGENRKADQRDSRRAAVGLQDAIAFVAADVVELIRAMAQRSAP